MQLSNHALDIESISVIKTHLLSIFIIIVAFGMAWKFVLPKFLDLYKKKLEIENKKIDTEKEIIKTTLVRWSDSQEQVNAAIIKQLDSLNKNMADIKEFIKNTIKASPLLMLFIFGCDSDMLVVYKFKQPAIEGEKQMQVKEEFKPCEEKCPPNKECDTTTGKCRDAVKPATNKSLIGQPVSDINLLLYSLTSR